ncbi:R3H domain-containing protein 1, partial [Entomortierella chlamydospora]
MHINAQGTSDGADSAPCDSTAQTITATAEEKMGVGSLDEILLKALKNRHERLFLLNLDQEFCNFIENASQKSLEFPCLNSYYRLMVHRSADYFKLERRVDHMQKIIVSKTEHSAIPILRFCHLVEEDDEEVEEPRSCQEPEEIKPIKVLKRSPARPISACETKCKDESAFSSRSTRTLSMEEREKSYAEARARIFQGDVSCTDHNLGGSENECIEGDLRQDEAFGVLPSPQRDDYHMCTSSKARSIQPKQSLDQLFGEAGNSISQQQKIRVRSPSTSSTASSSSGTTTTDISSRSDSTISSEFHSPGSASSYFSLCGGRTTGYSFAPGYDYLGRHSYQRGSGSMPSSSEQRQKQQRQSYHCDCYHQHRYQSDPSLIHGSPVHNDSRFYPCSSASSSSPSFESCHSSYCMYSQGIHTHNHAQTHNSSRPNSYPHQHHGSYLGQHS